MSLEARDIFDLSRRCGAILASRSISDLCENLATTIQHHVTASSVMLVTDPHQLPGASARIDIPVNSSEIAVPTFDSLRHDAAAALWQEYVRTPAFETLPDVFALDAKDDNRFSRDTALRSPVRSELVLRIRSSVGICGFISIARARGQDAFSDVDYAKAAVLAPAISGALNNILNLGRLLEVERHIGALTTAITFDGVLLLNDRLAIRYHGGRGIELLDQLRPADSNSVSSSDIGLPAALATPCSKLQRSPSQTEAVSLTLASNVPGQTIHVTIRRVSECKDTPMILIGMCSQTQALPSPEMLKKKGLTHRQIDILAGLCSGLTNREIADKRCISTFTVQSHVKSIYEKLDVHNRVGMMGALARMPR